MISPGTQLAKQDRFELAGIKVEPSKSVRLLGVEIDNNLNFDLHINKYVRL